MFAQTVTRHTFLAWHVTITASTAKTSRCSALDPTTFIQRARVCTSPVLNDPRVLLKNVSNAILQVSCWTGCEVGGVPVSCMLRVIDRWRFRIDEQGFPILVRYSWVNEYVPLRISYCRVPIMSLYVVDSVLQKDASLVLIDNLVYIYCYVNRCSY